MKKAMLIILDGFGINERNDFNAIANAKTPFLDYLYRTYPHEKLYTSGLHVGLPEGQMGNSEVGHITIGSGRIVYQESTRISKSIKDGAFYRHPILLEALTKIKKEKKKFHIMGLLSDGGVHSDQEHAHALLRFAKENHCEECYIHAFLDGRDTAPNSALTAIDKMEKECQKIGIGKIADVCGRYYAMDRDKRWDRIEKAYRCMTGDSNVSSLSVKKYIEASYEQKIYDEFIIPQSFDVNGKIDSGDLVVFFNFRADRARQITRAFADEHFSDFERPFLYPHFIQFTEYDSHFPLATLFPQQELKNSLAEVLSKNQIKQLRCAETEKYAHITFFFNGGNDIVYDGEERLLIDSPKDVSTYDQKPEMSAYLVSEKILDALENKHYQFIAINFANGDMVGHTGNYEAAIKAIEVLDDCLAKIVPKALENSFQILITADHGNAEQMRDYESGLPFTQHTTGPVPVIYVSSLNKSLKKERSLEDIAPTILEILGINKAPEMTGTSLLMEG